MAALTDMVALMDAALTDTLQSGTNDNFSWAKDFKNYSESENK